MENRIRLLIVDDAAPMREVMRKMLEMEGDFLVVGEAVDGEEAVAAARRLSPDVIIMDVNMPRMDGVSAAGIILSELRTSVIMVSVESEMDYLRRAMQSGVRDYLLKPFSSEELAQAIRRCGCEERSDQAGSGGHGRMVAVFATKGGVGRSTIAANLALALAMDRTESPVVLADLDLEFGVQAQHLSLKPANSIVDLCRLPEMITPERVGEVLVPYREANLHLLATPPFPHLAAEVEGEAKADRGRNYVEETLRSLREGWRHVVVDAGNGFRETSLLALDMADIALIVTTPEIPALHNTAKALNALLNQLEYPRERIRVVLNKAGGTPGVGEDDVAGALDFPVWASLPQDRLVPPSVNAGRPVLGRRSRSPFGREMGRLVEKLNDEMDVLEQEETVEESGKRGRFR